MSGWDIESGPAAESAELPGAIAIYLWGALIVFALALAFGGWVWDKAQRQGDDTLWTYFVMAMLWPLFVCAVVFMVLWTILTSSHHRR